MRSSTSQTRSPEHVTRRTPSGMIGAENRLHQIEAAIPCSFLLLIRMGQITHGAMERRSGT